MKWFVAFVLFLYPSAYAETILHQAYFGEGRYLEAASLTRISTDPDDLSFAARCLLAEAMSAADQIPPQSYVEEAASLARQAVETAPNHIEGRLQLAIALSLKARPLSTREAMRSGYGSEAKRLAEAVLEDDADNLYAHGFLAIWNIEVVRRGGRFGASFLGASIKSGRAHYKAAIEAAPNDASTHWQWAKALTALNAKKYRDEIETALAAALRAETGSALEQVMQARASILQDALDTQPRKKVEALAARML